MANEVVETLKAIKAKVDAMSDEDLYNLVHESCTRIGDTVFAGTDKDSQIVVLALVTNVSTMAARFQAYSKVLAAMNEVAEKVNAAIELELAGQTNQPKN